MHCLIPDFTMRRTLSVFKDHKTTKEFIDHISKASINTNEKIPASIPPALVNNTSIESVPPVSVSKDKQTNKNKANKKANNIAKKRLLNI